MQTMNSAPARNSIANTKISVPAGAEGKGVGLGNQGFGVNEGQNDAIARPGAKRAIAGFSGAGLIKAKV